MALQWNIIVLLLARNSEMIHKTKANSLRVRGGQPGSSGKVTRGCVVWRSPVEAPLSGYRQSLAFDAGRVFMTVLDRHDPRHSCLWAASTHRRARWRIVFALNMCPKVMYVLQHRMEASERIFMSAIPGDLWSIASGVFILCGASELCDVPSCVSLQRAGVYYCFMRLHCS